jgi:hypothetical protein
MQAPPPRRWGRLHEDRVSPAIYKLSLSGRSLVEHRPVFTGGPLCCPSYYHHWGVSWNGHGWLRGASQATSLEPAGIEPATSCLQSRRSSVLTVSL